MIDLNQNHVLDGGGGSAGSGGNGSGGTSQAISTLTNLLDEIFDIVQGIGVLLLAVGVILLVLAIKTEDPEAKTRAILFIVVAIVLIFIGTILNPIFSELGYQIK